MWRKLLLSILLCSCASATQLKPVRGMQLVHRGLLSNRGLVGFWPMNEGGGTKVFDAIHGYTTQTWYGMDTTNWSPGYDGPALTFDGSGEMIDIATPPGMSAGRGTVVMRVLVSASGAVDYCFGHYLSGNRIYIGSDSLNFVTRLGSTLQQDSGVNFVVGEWAMVALAWDGTTGYAYFDGRLVDSYSYTGLALLETTIGIGSFAEHADGTANTWTGKIGSMAIYNRALTPSEIASLYRDPWQGFRREPVELYVTTGGEPPTGTEQIQIITIASVPAFIVLLALGMAYSDRRRAA